MKRERYPAKPEAYTLEVLGQRYPVSNMVQASDMISRLNSQYGASEIGSTFLIRDGETVIGYVSYNGKVWKGLPDDFLGRRTKKLMYDPFAADPVHYSGREYVDR